MKKSRKIIIVVIAVIVIVFVIGGIIKSRGKSKDKGSEVRLEQAQKGRLTEIVSAPGEIEPKKSVEISAKISARIVELPFEEGDVVTCGDPDAEPPSDASVLVRLDSKDLESQLLSAEAGRSAQAAQVEVEKAKIASQQENIKGLAASLKQAEQDLNRKKELLESHDISQAAFDEIQCKVDELKAQYAAAKHTLESAKLNLVVLKHNLEAADARIDQARDALSYTIMTSPIDGIVTRINAEVGEVVMTGTMNNPGTVIMEVADLSKMLVVAEIDEADIGGLELGQQARVSVQAFPDIEFTGVVDSIALTHRFSNTGTKFYRTEILLDNDPNVAKLYSGLTAHVDVETQTHTDVFTVPSQAVLATETEGLSKEIRDNSELVDKNKKFTTVVYRYNDAKAVVTPVKIGPSNLTHTIILEGINEDDRIVAGPYKVLENLKHDQKLKDEDEKDSESKEGEDEQADANEIEK